jgi:hypothetical protein
VKGIVVKGCFTEKGLERSADAPRICRTLSLSALMTHEGRMTDANGCKIDLFGVKLTQSLCLARLLSLSKLLRSKI